MGPDMMHDVVKDIRIAYNSRFGADSSPGQAAAFYEYDVAAEDGYRAG